MINRSFAKGIESLKGYGERFGDADVPQAFEFNGFKLGKWVANQRGKYRSGAMSTEEIETLEELGFSWDPRDTLWDRNFQAFHAYVAANSETNVPSNYETPDRIGIGRWAAHQMSQLKQGKLPAKRREQIENLKYEIEDIVAKESTNSKEKSTPADVRNRTSVRNRLAHPDPGDKEIKALSTALEPFTNIPDDKIAGVGAEANSVLNLARELSKALKARPRGKISGNADDLIELASNVRNLKNRFDQEYRKFEAQISASQIPEKVNDELLHRKWGIDSPIAAPYYQESQLLRGSITHPLRQLARIENIPLTTLHRQLKSQEEKVHIEIGLKLITKEAERDKVSLTAPSEKFLWNINVNERFSAASTLLQSGIQSIEELINSPGETNIDFDDIKEMLKDAGQAWMATGSGQGENGAGNAALAAINNLPVHLIGRAQRVIFHITGGSDLTLRDVQQATDSISNAIDPEANIVFGMSNDPEMEDETQVMLIVAGLTNIEPGLQSTDEFPVGTWSDKNYRGIHVLVNWNKSPMPKIKNRFLEEGELKSAPLLAPLKTFFASRNINQNDLYEQTMGLAFYDPEQRSITGYYRIFESKNLSVTNKAAEFKAKTKDGHFEEVEIRTRSQFSHDNEEARSLSWILDGPYESLKEFNGPSDWWEKEE